MAIGTRLAPILALLFFLGRTGSAFGSIMEWWGDTLIYQISPRAFQDSDGDGNGDLKGILQRLDYLQNLGVETICLNPIYPSPMIAGGYDISNYTDIHPIFGEMRDFDRLVDEAHQRGMKVILDIVLNHSSDKHTWFYGSINRIYPYTDYYLWTDGKIDANGTTLAPNEWESSMRYDDETAWTWNDARGQWYYHSYLESQPDLNLNNRDVIQEILEIINFWLERDVDGFLISDVPHISERLSILEEEKNTSDALTNSFKYPETSKLLYQIREYTHNWSDVNNSTSKLMMTKAWSPDEYLLSYYDSEGCCGVVPLNFRLIEGIEESVTAGDIKFLIEGWLKILPENSTTNWALSTDKHSRITTRVGDKKLPGYLILSMLLPGQAYTYYGDEIGMIDSKTPWNDSHFNPISILLEQPNSLVEYSSPNAPPTTPMQWNNTTSAGFSTNDTTYLPVNEDYEYQNVERQLQKPDSTLNIYKSLAKLRKEPVFRNGNWEIETLNDDRILLLKRSLEGHPTYIILINTGNDRETVNISSLYPDTLDQLNIVLSTEDSANKSTVANDRVKLLPDAAMVLKSMSVVQLDVEYDWINRMELHETGLYDSDYEETSENLTSAYLSAEIDEIPFPLTFEEIQGNPVTMLKPINHTSERIQTSTVLAPKSVNNSPNKKYAENSSAYSHKMVEFILGFFCTITLILNYM